MKKNGRLGPLLLGAALLLAVVVGYVVIGSDSPPNVLLVVVDTLRADRLGCYGWNENTSPNLDRLASDGILFEKMICQVPQTLPSFCTILTGTHPVTHSVRVNGFFSLPSRAVTLAEVFRDEGYRTAAFIAGFPLDSRFGMDQGFETYSDEMKSHRPMLGLDEADNGAFDWLGHDTESFENTADVVTEQALRWLDEEDGRPFFAMVHFFDPHHDYAPPAAFRGKYRHPYSAEVAFTDQNLGRLMDRLREKGLEDDTLVIFTADHGECLGEHRRFFHQDQMVDAAIHIPFVARLPGKLPRDRRIPGICRSVDIMPTILDLAGLPLPEGIEGSTLVPDIGAGSAKDRICFFETLYGKLENDNGVTRLGIQDGNWKLVLNRLENPATGRGKEFIELYNLAADPDELNNLAAASVADRDRLRDLLGKFLKEHPPGRANVMAPDDATRRKLKALGYK